MMASQQIVETKVRAVWTPQIDSAPSSCCRLLHRGQSRNQTRCPLQLADLPSGASALYHHVDEE